MTIIGMAGDARGHGPTRSTGLWQRWRAAWRRRRLYRETHEGLAALSDAELADVGVTRSQIAAVARIAVGRL